MSLFGAWNEENGSPRVLRDNDSETPKKPSNLNRSGRSRSPAAAATATERTPPGKARSGLVARDIEFSSHSEGNHTSWLFPTWGDLPDRFHNTPKNEKVFKSQRAAAKQISESQKASLELIPDAAMSPPPSMKRRSSLDGTNHSIAYSPFHGEYMDKGVAAVTQNLVQAYTLRQLGGSALLIKRQYTQELIHRWQMKTMRNVMRKYLELRSQLDTIKENHDRIAFHHDGEISSIENQLEIKKNELEEARGNEERYRQSP